MFGGVDPVAKPTTRGAVQRSGPGVLTLGAFASRPRNNSPRAPHLHVMLERATPRVFISALFLAALCVSAPTLCAQGPGAPGRQPGAEEQKQLSDMGQRLEKYARQMFDVGYPTRAREIWFEVLNHYDEDNAPAREALGYQRIGTSWARRSDFDYPIDDKPDENRARGLNKMWNSLARTFGDEHREIAESLRETGDTAGAAYHFQRALRFAPEDKSSIAASGFEEVDGLTGTALELELLRRSRLIEKTVEKVMEEKYRTKKIKSLEHRYLKAAGLDLGGYESDRFRIVGTYPDEVLEAAVVSAERSWELCSALFEGYPEFQWTSVANQPMTMLFFEEKDDWKAFLRANASAMSESTLEFTLENASATSIGSGPDRLYTAGPSGEAVVLDLAARWTAQHWAGFGSDAMHEGIGHAIVGMLYGQNLVFSVGQREEQQSGTTTGAQQRRLYKLQLPDIEVWRELAVEIAAERSDMPSAKLPEVSAAEFPDIARIKAWGINDYFLRRDPRLAKELDRCRGNQTKVAEAFQSATGESIWDMDRDWRAFWTDETAVLKAIRKQDSPLDAVTDEAIEWLDEFNALRQAAWARTNGPDGKPLTVEPVGWSAKYSIACAQHGEYLSGNRRARGPDAEHDQDLSKDGTPAGRAFAQTALVSVGEKDPGKAMEGWMDLPGYRDALLARSLQVVGLHVDKGVAVFDVQRGHGAAGSSAEWPRDKGTNVPTEVEISRLGEDVAEEFKQRKVRGRTVGYPLSIHFFRDNGMPPVEAKLTRDGEEIEGFLKAGSWTNRRASAPGMVVFFPLEPLPKGVPLKLVWTVHGDQGTKEYEIGFTTQ
jgi:tetratricopeptide (TPR) repeat protein